MFPNISGSRIVLIDDKSDAFVYNPVMAVPCSVLCCNIVFNYGVLGAGSAVEDPRIPSRCEVSIVGECST